MFLLDIVRFLVIPLRSYKIFVWEYRKRKGKRQMNYMMGMEEDLFQVRKG